MSDAHSGRPRLVGVEHEYRVSRAGGQVDFRTMIHGLDVDGLRIDPGDRHAYYLPSGVKLTCDGREAEYATPPIGVEPGFIDELVAWTGVGARELTGLVGGDVEIEGVSTHISVSIDDALGPRAAGMFTRTFAPALMLLMDGPDSPGMLVRPRFGRLEFGGEFVSGDQLRAAIAMAVGATVVCEEAARSFRRKSRLPPAVRVDVQPAVDRYGWFVARDAFGVDLYADGRAARLGRELVGSFAARRHLETAWRSARAVLAALSDDDLLAADAIVAGRAPIPIESGVDTRPPPAPLPPPAPPFEVRPVGTPSQVLRPVVATWDYVVFEAAPPSTVVVSVPAAALPGFVAEVGSMSGPAAWDGRLARAIGRPRLANYEDAVRGGLWGGVEISPHLAAPERGPDGGLDDRRT